MTRLLDFKQVPFLHSQTIYHTVAYCTPKGAAGTIAILSPADPYICIGYHQQSDHEIDVAYCRSRGLPILRREVGGGAVYLDKNQLFFQCVFPVDRAPRNVEHLFKLFLTPAVNTYRRLGVDAFHTRGHDIQVGEKKICGTGAGRIGDAVVVVGNILFDFDYGEMARALKAPSEGYRRKVRESMELYLTTLRRELGYLPPVEDVTALLIQEFEAVLGASLRPAALDPAEQRTLAAIDRKFSDPAWVHQKDGKKNNGVKINHEVWIKAPVCQAPQGPLRLIIRSKAGVIDDMLIAADNGAGPAEALSAMAARLIGQPLESDALSAALEACFAQAEIAAAGLGPQEVLRAIMSAKN